MRSISLAMTARQHAHLQQHLFPGDGCEAVALLLCGRARGGDRHGVQRLVVHRVVAIPYDRCVRAPDRITWQTHPYLFDLLADAASKGMAIVKIHSHPTGFEAFSPTDDASDRELFDRVFPFLDSDEPHGSAIMLPSGRVFGRWFDEKLVATAFTHIAKIGDDVEIWPSAPLGSTTASPAAERTLQVLGEATFAVMRRLRVAVVGCSGTGSIVIEQLARLGIGHLILIDPDVMEYRNLNRILNSTNEDAALGRPKVEVMARAIARMGLGTTVELHHANLLLPSSVRAASTADALFGCMDGVEGRNALNRIAAAYVQPYIDVGVRLDADGKGGIEDIWGTVHYVQPDGSSLMERGLYTREDLDAEGLKRTDPDEYRRRRKVNYIRGVPEDRPAVVSTNALYAALAVNELLARLHRFRWEPNSAFAVHRYSLTRDWMVAEGDGAPSARLAKLVGRGDMRPLLDMPELSE